VRIVPACFFALACNGGAPTGPVLVDGEPACDGQFQAGEGISVDQVFDQDGDGFVDGANAECAETFDSHVLDCDDANVQRSPGREEQHCNGVDDDCNEDTPDGFDLDGDGFDGCTDCADDDPFRNPGKAELCWDDIDNNCDTLIDPGCGPNYNGVYELDEQLVYSCTGNLVSLDFSQIQVLWIPPDAALVSIGSGQPGSLSGTIEADGSFDLFDSRPLASGLCQEDYRWVGQFTGITSFDAELTATYFGGFCNTCEDQTWTVHAERVE
jgi:Putative metal-binding motif